jgi:hypothetical protein
MVEYFTDPVRFYLPICILPDTSAVILTKTNETKTEIDELRFLNFTLHDHRYSMRVGIKSMASILVHDTSISHGPRYQTIRYTVQLTRRCIGNMADAALGAGTLTPRLTAC